MSDTVYNKTTDRTWTLFDTCGWLFWGLLKFLLVWKWCFISPLWNISKVSKNYGNPHVILSSWQESLQCLFHFTNLTIMQLQAPARSETRPHHAEAHPQADIFCSVLASKTVLRLRLSLKPPNTFILRPDAVSPLMSVCLYTCKHKTFVLFDVLKALGCKVPGAWSELRRGFSLILALTWFRSGVTSKLFVQKARDAVSPEFIVNAKYMSDCLKEGVSLSWWDIFIG